MTYDRQDRRPVLWAIGATLALVFIIAGVTLLMPPVEDTLLSDKVYHTLGFASLTVFLPLARPPWALWVIVGAMAFGGTVELIQPFFDRRAEWGDLWANGLGALIGATAGAAAGRYLGAKRG